MTPFVGHATVLPVGPVFEAFELVTDIVVPLSTIVVRPVYTYPFAVAVVSSAEFVDGGVSDGALWLIAPELLFTVYVVRARAAAVVRC